MLVLVYAEEPMYGEGLKDLLGTLSFESKLVLDFRGLMSLAGSGRFSVLVAAFEGPCDALKLQALGSFRGTAAIVVCKDLSVQDATIAISAGILGAMRKDSRLEQFKECLEEVLLGNTWVPSDLSAPSSQYFRSVSLTEREVQLVRLLNEGLKNKEIAARMKIGEGTTKVYLSRLSQKIGVKNRLELAKWARENNVI